MAHFLTAEWRHLAMLNYEIDPAVLKPHVPTGTELDQWNGITYVSMVGFMFRDVRLLGLPIPFHRTFEEVNLRFYVRRREQDGWRRGVVFIREIVPLPAVALVARVAYGENYVARPMQHRIDIGPETGGVSYLWMTEEKRWEGIEVETIGTPQPIESGSEEEFITEHYWGYSRTRSGRTIEYRVDHPRWSVWQVRRRIFECDVARFYGPQYVPYLTAEPRSAFVADGSPISVFTGTSIA